MNNAIIISIMAVLGYLCYLIGKAHSPPSTVNRAFILQCIETLKRIDYEKRMIKNVTDRNRVIRKHLQFVLKYELQLITPFAENYSNDDALIHAQALSKAGAGDRFPCTYIEYVQALRTSAMYKLFVAINGYDNQNLPISCFNENDPFFKDLTNGELAGLNELLTTAVSVMKKPVTSDINDSSTNDVPEGKLAESAHLPSIVEKPTAPELVTV